LCLALAGCFWGPDSYEKEVNQYFFLYSDDYSTWDVRLGTIDSKGYGIGNGYLSFIKRIGWDDSFLICETKIKGYFIQDLRYLKGKHPDQFWTDRYGPYEKQSAFNAKRDSLGVSQDLEFGISY
jgi:hypothetical protein